MGKDSFIITALRALVVLISLAIMLPSILTPDNMVFQVTACVYGLGKLIDSCVGVMNSGYRKNNVVCIVALIACLLSISINFAVFSFNQEHEEKNTITTVAIVQDEKVGLNNLENSGVAIENQNGKARIESIENSDIKNEKGSNMFIGVNVLVVVLLMLSSLPDLIALGQNIARIRNTKLYLDTL